MNIFLSSFQKDDIKQLPAFLDAVISDAFKKDGIDDKEGEKEEIQKQFNRIKESVKTSGESTFFIVARNKDDNKIIGTIGYEEPNDLIKENLNVNLANVPEITSALVLPVYQGRRIGSLLFQEILKSLKQKNIHKFCLDGGYKKSQGFWTKKLGEPDVILKDHYGKGLPYMIWYRDINKIQV